MNLNRYTETIEELLYPLRECVSDGATPSASQVSRTRKAVHKLHKDAVRDINIRSSQDARHRGFLREQERIELLQRLASFMGDVDVELDSCTDPS